MNIDEEILKLDSDKLDIDKGTGRLLIPEIKYCDGATGGVCKDCLRFRLYCDWESYSNGCYPLDDALHGKSKCGRKIVDKFTKHNNLYMIRHWSEKVYNENLPLIIKLYQIKYDNRSFKS